MTFLDLLAKGITVDSLIERDQSCNVTTIILGFGREGKYYKRVIGRKEIVLFDGGGTGSILLEALICREVLAFWGIEVETTRLKIGDWAICSESGVIGRIIKTYTPTACEDQIMVETRDGRQYHAPARTWKPYLFGTSASQMCTDELYQVAKANPNIVRCSEILNVEREILNAHREYLKHDGVNEKILKEINPPISPLTEEELLKRVGNELLDQVKKCLKNGG